VRTGLTFTVLHLYLTYTIKIHLGDKVPILLGRDAVLLGMWFPAFQDKHMGLFFKD